jgi:hypothetical protein
MGWWYLEDSTGNLARRDMTITTDTDSWFTTTWFIAGTNALHIEEAWRSAYYCEEYYMPDEWYGPGIDFFLRTVWFRGVTSGDRMEQLLTICNARRIGRDTMNAGSDRQLIYEIPANELDLQNGRGSLLVWVSVGYYRLIRTRLHTVYATEVTDFENVQEGVEIDPMTFYSEYLPEDIYWSMDHYLLTHESPFFGTPESVTYTPTTSDENVSEGETGSTTDEGSSEESPEPESGNQE